MATQQTTNKNVDIYTGRRKRSIARVRITEGHGKITINEQDADKFLSRDTDHMIILQPLEITNTVKKYDFDVTVHGGGTTGQAGAIRLGIARALQTINPKLRAVLKKAGFLTRDSREVERKKYGKSGARKRYQFSKR